MIKVSVYLIFCLLGFYCAGPIPTKQSNNPPNKWVIAGSEATKPDQRVLYFSRALALDSTNIYAFRERGQAYFTLGQYHKAIMDFSHALTLGVQDPVLLTQRGHAYQILGRFAEAVRDYRQAIAVSPGFSKAAEKLQMLKEQLGGILPNMPDTSPPNLTGKWESKDIKWAFYNDGKFTKKFSVNNDSVWKRDKGKYFVHDEQLVLQWGEFEKTIHAFQIQNNRLWLDGQPFIRTRGSMLSDNQLARAILGTWIYPLGNGPKNYGEENNFDAFMIFYPKQPNEAYARLEMGLTPYMSGNPNPGPQKLKVQSEQVHYYINEGSLRLVNQNGKKETFFIEELENNYLTLGDRTWIKYE